MEYQSLQGCFTHLSYEERVKIELLKTQGYSMKGIARTLHRSPSSICDELHHKQVNGLYHAKTAQRKTYQRRYWSKYQCYKGVVYETAIREKLMLRWSPERIAGWLRLQGIAISAKAVYKFMHSRCLEQYLWKPKRKKQRKATYLHDQRKFTELEPVFQTGHWEVDFVVCSQNAWCLLVTVDRWSRLTLVQVLPDKTKTTLFQAFTTFVACHTVKTVTTDNDIAFGCWRELEQRFGVSIFFTHPYRSWEKPLVEETNQLIRRFVPKGANLKLVSGHKLETIHRFLNETPRQCLNYHTAYETHYRE